MVARIIALDPGGTTGWATLTIDLKKRTHEFKSGHLGPQKHHNSLMVLLENQHVRDTYVVSESFEFRQRARDNLVLVSLEYIGVTKLFCETRDVPLFMQTAAMGKGFAKDVHIKKLGLWTPGYKHAMDAMRHLLYFALNNKRAPVDFELRKALLTQGWK